MTTPEARVEVGTVLLTDETRKDAERVIARAIRVGKRGTNGDYTEAGLCFMFLGVLGTFGEAERLRIRMVLDMDEEEEET